MWRDDETPLARLQLGDILERRDRFGAGRTEVEQNDVTSGDRPLDTGNQDDSAQSCVAAQRSDVELFVVQSNRERSIAEAGRAIDELVGTVGNTIRRIVRCVRVELDLEWPPRQFADGRVTCTTFSRAFTSTLTRPSVSLR